MATIPTLPIDRATLVAALKRLADDVAAMGTMVPAALRGERDRPLVPPVDLPYRRSAVLVLLYPADNHWRLPLTVRTRDLRQHSGEVSFPGGRFDESDQTLERTALREAWEELGIPPANVEIVATLTPVWIPVSNFLVTPFVGFAAQRPTFDLATNEVALLVEAALHELMWPETRRSTQRIIRGVECTVPYFAVAGHEVWGATAIILAQLLNRLRE